MCIIAPAAYAILASLTIIVPSIRNRFIFIWRAMMIPPMIPGSIAAFASNSISVHLLKILGRLFVSL